MEKFNVTVIHISYGKAEIEAKDIHEARDLAEDLTAGDLDFDGTDTFREVRPL